MRIFSFFSLDVSYQSPSFSNRCQSTERVAGEEVIATYAFQLFSIRNTDPCVPILPRTSHQMAR